MLQLTNIEKRFGSQTVFSDFSYKFNNTGLYVLFGESGCGKTTLLNIIAGIEDFDSGYITVGGLSFDKKIEWNSITTSVGYMTQDPHWIDYLTVGEQLEMLGYERNQVIKQLKQFNMEMFIDRYFNELSGGQKQRVFLLQLLMQEKKIILLDEPTASLDAESKKSVFEMIHSLKDRALIICSSHDKELLAYSDYVIDITPKNDFPADNTVYTTDSTGDEQPSVSKNKRKPLYTYYKKWFSWKNREKKSVVILTIVYILVFLSLFVADTPSSKQEQSIKYMYKINQCIVTSEKWKDIEDIVNNDKNIISSVLVYNGSCPDYDKNGSPIDTLYNVIPAQKNAFNYSDKVIFGKYFSKKDQVILSYEKALEYGTPQDIIGETISLDMYNGNKEFQIAGVFDKFSKKETQYLNQSLASAETGIYLNSLYTEQFKNDDNFNWLGKRTYVLYFKSYGDMENFVKNHSDIDIVKNNIDYNITGNLELMFYILFPCTIVIAFFAALLFFQTKKLEILYNSHLVSLYEYLGFEKKEIEKCWIKGNLAEVSKTIGISGIVAFILSLLLNAINSVIGILPFVVFTYNWILIFGFAIFTVIISYLICKLNFKSIAKIKWYDLFLSQRDLL